eukprot:5454363-Pyramimonas_sp.AAC.1
MPSISLSMASICSLEKPCLLRFEDIACIWSKKGFAASCGALDPGTGAGGGAAALGGGGPAPALAATGGGGKCLSGCGAFGVAPKAPLGAADADSLSAVPPASPAGNVLQGGPRGGGAPSASGATR